MPVTAWAVQLNVVLVTPVPVSDDQGDSHVTVTHTEIAQEPLGSDLCSRASDRPSLWGLGWGSQPLELPEGPLLLAGHLKALASTLT